MGIRKSINKWLVYEDYVELYISNPTHGEFNLKIDLEDYERCCKYHWNIQLAGKHKYYAYSKINDKHILLHRFIMNAIDRFNIVDHINEGGLINELDNRKYNLRMCTQQENLHNVDKKANNTSGHKGVTWNKVTNSWMAYLKIDYKFKNLGYYDDIEDAVKARIKGENFYFGEFARCEKLEINT